MERAADVSRVVMRFDRFVSLCGLKRINQTSSIKVYYHFFFQSLFKKGMRLNNFERAVPDTNTILLPKIFGLILINMTWLKLPLILWKKFESVQLIFSMRICRGLVFGCFD